jgi:dynein heavy chain
MMKKEEAADDPKKVIRLWTHEVCRVFYDRLTNDVDQDWLYERLFKSAREKARDDLT